MRKNNVSSSISFRLDNSNSAKISCGNSSTNTRSLVKNQSACTLCTFRATPAATAPKNRMDDRIPRFIWWAETSGHTRRLMQFQLNIEPAERPGKARTRRCQRLEAEGGEDSCRPGIPGVREEQRGVAVMECRETL